MVTHKIVFTLDIVADGEPLEIIVSQITDLLQEHFADIADIEVNDSCTYTQSSED